MKGRTPSRIARCLLLASAPALLGVSARAAGGPVVPVPRGSPVVIDGRMDEAEWEGSVPHRLSDGTTIRLRHDGRHLFVAIASSRQGFTSVCVAKADSVRVFHASAALGSVTYERAAREWAAPQAEFVYGMRNTDLGDQAREERREYLARHGWVASTFAMGNGLVQELQFSLAQITDATGLALAYYVAAGEAGEVVTWPSTLAPDDGCGDERLVRGQVPPGLRFGSSGWATLTFDP